jgi:hypothetical protein
MNVGMLLQQPPVSHLLDLDINKQTVYESGATTTGPFSKITSFSDQGNVNDNRRPL